ncbi:hypothetical protein AB0M36_34825 [Actinoplanes sp. NPDC051346]|uniref:hypothetical protein n=1 Tax=Actinoplanes sp. NPDC051346 TaxID=3155048 RepID=UPI00343DB1C6
MAARVNYSVATLSAAASGRRLPTLEVTSRTSPCACSRRSRRRAVIRRAGAIP